MRKKVKRTLITTLAVLLGIGLTATIGYFSRGFDSWSWDEWKQRIPTVTEPAEEDDDENPLTSGDEIPTSEEEE